jgi:carboxymethylenebutenolidase
MILTTAKSSYSARPLLPFLLALVLAGLASCASNGLPAGTPVKDLVNTTFSAADGSTSLVGYLARPQGAGPFPAVLMIHEWWGLTEDITRKADLLSRDGFVVLAVDAYRGRSASTVPGAIALVSSTPKERIAADVDAGWSYLESLPSVDPRRIGAVGFCFGGTQTMLLGIRNPDLRAAVIFYGSGPVTDPAKLGRLGDSGPVLGIFGDKDGSIPTSQALAFGEAMKSKGVDARLSIYANQGHAFVKYDTLDQPGASRDAWREMRDFLVASLRP